MKGFIEIQEGNCKKLIAIASIERVSSELNSQYTGIFTKEVAPNNPWHGESAYIAVKESYEEIINKICTHTK